MFSGHIMYIIIAGGACVNRRRVLFTCATKTREKNVESAHIFEHILTVFGLYVTITCKLLSIPKGYKP